MKTDREPFSCKACPGTCRVKAWTYHGRVGSRRRTTGRRGGAGPGRTGLRRIGKPRRKPFLVPFKASNAPVLNDSSEARTREIPCKPKEEQNLRLTSGLPVVYKRFISGLSAGRNPLFVPGC